MCVRWGIFRIYYIYPTSKTLRITAWTNTKLPLFQYKNNINKNPPTYTHRTYTNKNRQFDMPPHNPPTFSLAHCNKGSCDWWGRGWGWWWSPFNGSEATVRTWKIVFLSTRRNHHLVHVCPRESCSPRYICYIHHNIYYNITLRVVCM